MVNAWELCPSECHFSRIILLLFSKLDITCRRVLINPVFMLCLLYVSTAGNLSSQYRWPCLWHSYGYTHVWTIVLDCLYRNTGYLYQEFYKLWCICHGCLFMNTDYGLTMLVSGRLLLYACQYLINVLMCSMTYQQLMTNNNTD